MDQFISITPKGRIFDGRGPAFVREQLTAGMHEAVAFLEEKVKENLPTEVDGVERGVGVFGDKGGLRGRIYGEVERGTLYIRGIVGHQSPYGDIIERGRRPGPVKKGVLVRWIEVKFGVDTKEAQRLEFVVRRKIAQKGFPGVHMFERALNDNFSQVVRIFDTRGFAIARSI